jgi:hypothetical protein
VQVGEPDDHSPPLPQVSLDHVFHWHLQTVVIRLGVRPPASGRRPPSWARRATSGPASPRLPRLRLPQTEIRSCQCAVFKPGLCLTGRLASVRATVTATAWSEPEPRPRPGLRLSQDNTAAATGCRAAAAAGAPPGPATAALTTAGHHAPRPPPTAGPRSEYADGTTVRSVLDWRRR